MATSPLVLKGRTIADVVTTSGTNFTLVSQTATGAIYRDSTRSLSLPCACEFQYKLGSPGQRGNDSLKIIITDAKVATLTNEIVVLRTVLEMSVPRQTNTIADTDIQDHLGYLTSIIGIQANRVAFSDAAVA